MLAWWLFQKLVLPIQTRLASSRHIIAGGFNLVNLWGWKDPPAPALPKAPPAPEAQQFLFHPECQVLVT